MKNRSEIGSEFWLELDDGATFGQSGSKDGHTFFLLSGRTALDYIIRDIKAGRKIDSVYIPSYCCESMIEPFVRNGIGVKFYEVSGGKDGFQPAYECNNRCDAVLLLDYFGYENGSLAAIAESARNAGEIVIYDATHKLNGHLAVEALADYTFCSYRKWFFSNAAIIQKNGAFLAERPAYRNTRYEELRNRASELKCKYMTCAPAHKQDYLGLFGEAEKLLEKDYIDYVAEPASVDRLSSVDFEQVVQKRRENARHLISGLNALGFDWLTVAYQRIQPADCPLFVPVLIDSKLRDKVRRQLVDQRIYCPVHWPLSRFHQASDFNDSWKSIYLSELSLVCDQRYDIEDMDRIVEAVKYINDTFA